MKHLIKRVTTGMAILILVMAIAGSQAWGEVNVNINVGIPLPPPVVVSATPMMIFLPEPGIYVAIGVPYYIFFISGRYYYFHDSRWFWAPGYGGPWGHVVHKSLPPGLRKYKIEEIHRFREREFNLYKAQGPKYKGRHFSAVEGPGHKAEEHPQKGNKKHGKGKHD